MKEQNKYDQIPLGLFDRLLRIMALADKVADEFVCDETDILERIIPRMFTVTKEAAEYSCAYIRRGRRGRQQPFLDLARADDCSEDGWRPGQPGHDRRN